MPLDWSTLTASDRIVVTPGAARSGRPSFCGPGCRRAHTYVADGRRLCWRPDVDADLAVDAEMAGRPAPEALRRRWDGPDEGFLPAWTRAEVCAKLTDTPILVWVHDRGLDAPLPDGVQTHHAVLGDLVVCFGVRGSGPLR